VSLPWVKLHTSLLDNETFQRFTPGAKLTFLTALMIAGKQDLGGRLEAPPFGAIDSKSIALKTGCKIKMQDEALSELVTAGFLTVDLNGTYIVERWEEKTGSAISTTRTRALRERKRNDEGTFPNGSPRTRGENEEVEAEVDYTALRAAATGRSGWPKTPEGMRELAVPFVSVFANCRNKRKQPPHVTEYASVLTIIAGKGLTIEQAWDAFEKAWRTNDEEPLWRAEAKRALAHIPSRPPAVTRKRENDRGTDFNKVAERRKPA
jgi:hypothetical protein